MGPTSYPSLHACAAASNVWAGAGSRLDLDRQDRIGSIAPGKNADIVVIRGNPASKVEASLNMTASWQILRR